MTAAIVGRRGALDGVTIEHDPTVLKSPVSPGSNESQAWLERVRDGVKARLFEGVAAAPTPDDPRMRDVDPTRIGRYVVIKRIGVGGMGLIYAAYDDQLDRKVAVKLLRPERIGGDMGQARLLREAQALARLNHPSVIHVYEVGTHEDEVFISMEYVEGITLKLWQGAHGWREILRTYIAAGEGLVAAHAAGIVHRDFKADNVLVRSDGAVRVLDFGLAQTGLQVGDAEVQELRDDAPVDEEIALTRTGAVMGTPAYMAPEQHVSGPMDARTDQFSFCVSLYEALYGYRPFAGTTLEELRANVIAGRFEASAHFTEVPPLIRRALETGLSVEPDERFQSLQELLAELAPPEPKRRWGIAAVLAGLMAAGAASVTWWAASETAALEAEGERLRGQFEEARMLSAEDELRRLQERTVSERWDDLVLAYADGAADSDATRALAALKHLSVANVGWLDRARAIAADASRKGPVYDRWPTMGRLERVAFDPNSTHLAGIDALGTARLWAVDGKELHTIAIEGARIGDIAFSPDGARLWAAASDGSVYAYNLQGEQIAQHAVAEASLTGISTTAAGISPEDPALAVGTSDGHVLIVSAEGEVLNDLAHGASRIATVAYHPHRPQLASGSSNGTVRLWFLERNTHWTLELEEEATRLQWSAGGTRLVATAADRVVAWSEDDGTVESTKAPGQTRHYAVVDNAELAAGVSPDGQLQLFSEGLEAHALTAPGAKIADVAVSPDGQWVAATDPTSARLWRAQTASGDPSAGGYLSFDALDYAPVVGAEYRGNGDLITASGDGSIARWNSEGNAELVTDTAILVHSMRLAPDGHNLALEDREGNLHVLDLDSPTELRGLGRPSNAARGTYVWSPQSNAIAKVHCAVEAACSIRHHAIDGSAPTSLGVVPGSVFGLRFSNDGRFVASEHALDVFVWDVESGDGSAVEFAGPSPNIRRERLATSFVGDDAALRVATVEWPWNIGDDPPEVTLRIWQSGSAREVLHEVLVEEHVVAAAATRNRDGLLLQTADQRTLVWFLDADRFQLLPLGILPHPAQIRGVRAASDRSALLVDLELGSAHVLIDLQTGQRRRLPVPLGPVAWSPWGTIADVSRSREIRHWVDPSPNDGAAFLAWLEEVTRTSVDPSSLH